MSKLEKEAHRHTNSYYANYVHESAPKTIDFLNLYNQFIDGALYQKKLDSDLSSLLEEALDWLCAHPGAKEVFSSQSRFWCCNCHNYIHNEDEASLTDRIRKVLESK